MTELADLQKGDLEFMRSDLPTSMTWNGATYSVIFGDLSDQDEIEIAGIMPSRAAEIVLIQADFATLPGVGDTVTVNGTKWRIARCSDDPSGTGRTLTVEAVT